MGLELSKKYCPDNWAYMNYSVDIKQRNLIIKVDFSFCVVVKPNTFIS